MIENEDFSSALVSMIIIVIIVMAACLAYLGDNEIGKENLKMNLRMNVKVLFGMWMVNLIAFTTCLWLGAYALDSGVKWIEGPVNTTLISTGIAKIILSALLFVGMSDSKAKS